MSPTQNDTITVYECDRGHRYLERHGGAICADAHCTHVAVARVYRLVVESPRRRRPITPWNAGACDVL